MKFLFAFPLTYILRKTEEHNINYIFIILLFETGLSKIVLHSIIRNRLFYFILNQEEQTLCILVEVKIQNATVRQS